MDKKATGKKRTAAFKIKLRFILKIDDPINDTIYKSRKSDVLIKPDAVLTTSGGIIPEAAKTAAVTMVKTEPPPKYERKIGSLAPI